MGTIIRQSSTDDRFGQLCGGRVLEHDVDRLSTPSEHQLDQGVEKPLFSCKAMIKGSNRASGSIDELTNRNHVEILLTQHFERCGHNSVICLKAALL